MSRKPVLLILLVNFIVKTNQLDTYSKAFLSKSLKPTKITFTSVILLHSVILTNFFSLNYFYVRYNCIILHKNYRKLCLWTEHIIQNVREGILC